MKSSIYEYRDYKDYFLDLIESNPATRRGMRKELSEAIGCQVSHITNVLSGAGHFSQEQAEAAARFFGLSSLETEFVLLLVQYNRAGTSSLKSFYEKILNEKQVKCTSLKSTLEMPDSLQQQDEALYYSSWQFAAVHVLVSIPEFQNREAIAKKLELPIARVDEILAFLCEKGLIAKEGTRFKILRALIHLDKSSPLISKHHSNWRLKSMQSMEYNAEEKVHYSSVFSVSKKDYPRVQELLKKSLSESMKVIAKSPEEELAVICVDLFKI
ncbi:MAG: TIGR02147 family protein [Bdellovibrio sp.]|nr:TIGR02147 family protein [Bdellovibrio sp.]